MSEDKRIPLNAGQSIMLSLDADGNAPQKYIIQSIAGKGGSVICYNAIRVRDGATGKLKEFYPHEAGSDQFGWYYSLERCRDGQLIPKGGTIRKFSEMCDDYLYTYKLLNEAMTESPENQVLKNYVQSGEILYGCANSETMAKYPLEADGTKRRYGATVYIWTNGPVGMGFDEYLADVRSNPGERADFRLYDILNTVFTLADSICAIHSAGLLHMDIKPDNFLVPYDSSNGINTNCVSLFDISTFYSVKSMIPRLAGTDGYRAPEVLRGKADNRSDIYSIGAMLFHGLVVADRVPDGLYRDSYYADIDRMVRHSALIRNTNAGVRQISHIANIMKKCLAPNPAHRYQQCSDLLGALQKAVFEAQQNAVDPKLIGQNKKMAVVDLNEKGINSPDIVIQKMLYDHPLYEALTPESSQINVLVIGSGTYGQKFMDRCLQAGQMKGYSLCITAVSPTPEEDKEAYLQFRPALSRFVDVNGSMQGDPKAYATVRFISINAACGYADSGMCRFARGKKNPENRRIVGDLIAGAAEHEHLYDYIFIALGDSALNREVAKLCSEEDPAWGKKVRCPICYISEQTPKKVRRNRESMLYPVYVNEPITPESINPILEQMAFNADIAWNSSLNIDVRAAFEQFRNDAYRYGSSLAFALSVPYKLFSIGIVLQNHIKPFTGDRFPGAVLVNDPQEAAAVFASEVLGKKAADADAGHKFNTLVCLEHRRWVLSLVCEGWNAPLDENGKLDLGRCVSEGMVKNKSKLTHPCIVFSTEDTPLSSSLYGENGHRKWEDTNIDPGLDELDRMSVELHQRFRERASIFKASNPLQGEDILAIDTLISAAEESVIRAYKQFLFCLKNILNGVESYTKQFDYYKQCFTDELAKVPDETSRNVAARLDLISKAFFPVIEANLYRNYKANDEILIEKIPFILTYHFQDTLALAFEDGKHQNGRNEAVFTNVAAATVLCPEKIIYLYNYTVDTKLDLLVTKLSAVLNYLGKRKVHCKVSLDVAFPAGIRDSERDKLQKTLEKFKAEKQMDANASFVGYEILDCMDSEEAVSGFLRYLKEQNVSLCDGSTAIFDSAFDNAAFVNAVVKSGVPYFEFDWRHKQFTKHLNCEYLQYILDHSSIRIHDMFALMNAEDTRFNLPEFADDYAVLWGIYTGSDTPGSSFEHCVDDWNRLCRLLEDYGRQQKPIASIPLNGTRTGVKKTMAYLLPEYTFKTVKNILDKLIAYKAIDAGSAVTGYTSENCKVQIIADREYEAAFHQLFARPEILLSFYGVDAVKRVEYGDEYVHFVYRNMKVTDLNLDPDGRGRHRYLYEILKKLSEHHYIANLPMASEAPQTVSFEYTSPRIKKLLTSPGEILEVYTYYQILSTGYFDDVACGYEFRWQDGDVKNELDIVATKGFRSIIVECKAVQKLELDYYHKLHSIAEHFGIGAIKVMIGNTCQKNDAVLAASNQMQRSRGNQLNIVTVSDERKIMDIGQTLKSLMEK